MDYKQSGVDIDAGNEVVRRIARLARGTFTPGVLSDIGSFGGLFRFDPSRHDEPVLVASADGVGTKLRVAFLTGRHDTIGADLVNHCVNDILVQGAEPLFFLDYLATGRLAPDVAVQVVEGLAGACRENGCALLGGETAEMPGFYADGEDQSGRLHRRRRGSRAPRRRPRHPSRRPADGPAVVGAAHQRVFARAPDRVRGSRSVAGGLPGRGRPVPGRRAAARPSARTCRSSGRCSASAWSRAWRTSRAAASPRTCRACCPRAPRPAWTARRGGRSPSSTTSRPAARCPTPTCSARSTWASG